MLVPPDKADKLKLVLLDKQILDKYRPKRNKSTQPKSDTAKKVPATGTQAVIIRN